MHITPPVSVGSETATALENGDAAVRILDDEDDDVISQGVCVAVAQLRGHLRRAKFPFHADRRAHTLSDAFYSCVTTGHMVVCRGVATRMLS